MNEPTRTIVLKRRSVWGKLLRLPTFIGAMWSLNKGVPLVPRIAFVAAMVRNLFLAHRL